MKQKEWFFILAAGIFFLSAGESAFPDSPAVKKPNIIYFLADDLGKYELGCYGQEKIRTPRIDSLAADGMRFTQHYCGAPVCAPSRCVLLTGKHLGHAAIRDNFEVQPEGQRPLPAECVTVAEMLKAAGYATGAFGKWGLGFVGTEGDPNRQGFDEFFGYNCQREAHNYFPLHLWKNGEKVMLPGNTRGLTGEHYAQDVIMEEGKKFVRAHADGPFFMYVPFVIPHVALQTPADDPILAEYQKLGWDEKPYDGEQGYLPHPTPRAAYAAMVTRMDKHVGEILDLLEELGLAENTLVFFSSDNGATYNGGSDSAFFQSMNGLRGLKGSVYEGGIAAPLVVRWTGKIQPGTQTDVLSAFYDMMPTFAQAAGISADEMPETDGVSLLPTLTAAGVQRTHAFLLWDFPGYGGQQAVRFGDWKAVRTEIQKNPDAKIQLYNLKTDPGETKDVAKVYPAEVREAAETLRREIVPRK